MTESKMDMEQYSNPQIFLQPRHDQLWNGNKVYFSGRKPVVIVSCVQLSIHARNKGVIARVKKERRLTKRVQNKCTDLLFAKTCLHWYGW